MKLFTRDAAPGNTVKLTGWVSKIRDLGNIKFFLLRDREGVLQVTAKKDTTDPALLETILSLGREDVVTVEGSIIESSQAPGGKEMIPSSLSVMSKAAPLPIEMGDKIDTSLDKRLNWRVLDLRNPKHLAVFKIQSALLQGMQSFLAEKGFLQVFTPCLMGAASESGSDVFPVFYFNNEVYLRQDPQLHRELVIAAGFDRIYDLGPSWRAEPSHTSRHLCEHRGIAPEMTLETDEQETMRIEEGVVIAGLSYVKKHCTEELAVLDKTITVPEAPFPELRFPDIYDILENLGKKLPHGEDLDREAEKLLADHVKQKHKTDVFFINRFPYAVKPFYVMKAEDDPTYARSVDFVYKGTELSSGGQREHRHDVLMQQIKEKNMDSKSLEWFTEHFKYGVPPMGGFCIGIERFTMQMLDLPNVRETVLFARTPDRALP